MTPLLVLSINPLIFPQGFVPRFIARCASTWCVFQSRPTRRDGTWWSSVEVVDLPVDDTPPLLLTPALRVDLPEPETLFALPFDEAAQDREQQPREFEADGVCSYGLGSDRGQTAP